MTTSFREPVDNDTTAHVRGPSIRPRRILRDLEYPAQLFSNITPNWFASVMGTGIIATAAATLPAQGPLLHGVALVMWVLASVLLISLLAATTIHWIFHTETAKSHHRHSVMSHFYGAPAMALMTVGAGTLLVGRDLLGPELALSIDIALWSTGTALGLFIAVAIPYLQFTKHQVGQDAAFGGWLMPVVSPMVSASTGAMLLPYLPQGQTRQTMLLACYAMFGLSLLASMMVIPHIWGRLIHHKVGAAAAVPTLWIVLGPLGQSITAANLLGGNAHLAVSGFLAQALEAFGILYGVPVLGFALLWASIAAMVTIRTAREHLPFSLTWWSFTFPVGTCVTGLSGLAAHTGLVAFEVMAVAAFIGLAATWLLVATKTFIGSAIHGTLFLKVSPQEAEKSHANAA
ncbi:TDT family transporter [Arthrobacter sp. LAPM80]|uniref:TDT family transporter n=1 Tax=Arthrobacter sp. LAPM80 TaxID=3141788 RepID=UPI00398B17A1